MKVVVFRAAIQIWEFGLNLRKFGMISLTFTNMKLFMMLRVLAVLESYVSVVLVMEYLRQ